MDLTTQILGLIEVLVGTALSLGVLFVVYYLLTLPMRRAERARLFLDVLELGLKDGRTPEAAIVAAASSHDSALGARFHLIAALIEQGRTLTQALAAVPHALPKPVVSMLIAGERGGGVPMVLSACRKLLVDSTSQVRAALNYILLLTFAITPVLVAVPLVLNSKVFPVLTALMEGRPLPAITRLVFGANSFFVGGMMLSLLILWSLTFGYLGGSRMRSWFQRIAPWVVDRFLYSLPWRKTRLLRDFTSVLALLMDAGVPEARAVTLAGEAVDNKVISSKASKVRDQLASGIKITDSISAVDDSTQLQWRLRNALRRGSGFVTSLRGWHELLDAKAFQQEQAAAHLLTTFLVIFNGFLIGTIAAGFFMALVSIMYEAALW